MNVLGVDTMEVPDYELLKPDSSREAVSGEAFVELNPFFEIRYFALQQMFH